MTRLQEAFVKAFSEGKRGLLPRPRGLCHQNKTKYLDTSMNAQCVCIVHGLPHAAQRRARDLQRTCRDSGNLAHLVGAPLSGARWRWPLLPLTGRRRIVIVEAAAQERGGDAGRRLVTR